MVCDYVSIKLLFFKKKKRIGEGGCLKKKTRAPFPEGRGAGAGQGEHLPTSPQLSTAVEAE